MDLLFTSPTAYNGSIVELILQNTDLKTIRIFSLLNKQWNQWCSQNDSLWENIYFRHFPFPRKDNLLPPSIKKQKFLWRSLLKDRVNVRIKILNLWNQIIADNNKREMKERKEQDEEIEYSYDDDEEDDVFVVPSIYLMVKGPCRINILQDLIDLLNEDDLRLPMEFIESYLLHNGTEVMNDCIQLYSCESIRDNIVTSRVYGHSYTKIEIGLNFMSTDPAIMMEVNYSSEDWGRVRIPNIVMKNDLVGPFSQVLKAVPKKAVKYEHVPLEF